MPLHRNDLTGVWTATIAEDDGAVEPTYADALVRYLNIFDPLFRIAQQRNELEFPQRLSKWRTRRAVSCRWTVWIPNNTLGVSVPAPILDDRLWRLIEPLLPAHPRRARSPGRKRIEDRRCLTGILYVLRTGIPWEYLPAEMGCGSGVTCWRRLREWQAAGVWDELHRLLLAKLQAADRLDWSRVAVDSSTIRAVGAGKKAGQVRSIAAVQEASTTSSSMAEGSPCPFCLTRANVHDVTQLIPLVDAIPHVTGKVGHPRHRPRSLFADRAYDSRSHHVALTLRGIKPRIAKRGQPHGSGLGIYRWVVERTHAWLHQFRRLRVRFERRADIHEGFLMLGCALVCWRALRGSF